MRRLNWPWRRRQHAPAAEPTLSLVQYEPMGPLPAPEPVPTPPFDWSGYDIQAEADAIRRTVQMQHLPAGAQRIVRETAREIRSDLTGPIFAADGLPLMDDPFIADFNWNVRAFEALTKAKHTMPLHLDRALYALRQTPGRGTLTFTVFAPPLWCEDEAAMRSVELALRRQINEVVCFAIWARVTFTWRTSNDPAWAVSIAVDTPLEGVA
jgi:hypothetical protein